MLTSSITVRSENLGTFEALFAIEDAEKERHVGVSCAAVSRRQNWRWSSEQHNVRRRGFGNFHQLGLRVMRKPERSLNGKSSCC